MQIDSGIGSLVQAVKAEKAVVRDPLIYRAYPDLASLVDVHTETTPAAMVVVPNSWTEGRQPVTVVCTSRRPSQTAIRGHRSLRTAVMHALGLLEYCVAMRENQAEGRWCAWCRRAGSNRRRA